MLVNWFFCLFLNQAVQKKFSIFIIKTIRLLFFQRCTMRNTHDNNQIWIFPKILDTLCCILIRTQTRNEPVSNLWIRHKSIHSWMMFLILLLVNISYDTVHVNYNAYFLFYIWYIVKCRWLWICYKSDSLLVIQDDGKDCTRTVYKLSLFRAKNSLYRNHRLAAWPLHVCLQL